MRLVGEGWKQRVDPEKAGMPPNRRVTTVVKGKNIGYGATCECMVQSAIVILQETARLPSAGGVYSPGYAFADTSLVARFLFQLQMIQDCSVPPLQKRTYINNAQFSLFRLNKKEVTFTSVVEDI